MVREQRIVSSGMALARTSRVRAHLPTKSKRRQGFTLLELMIVVSIVSVVAALASLNITRTKQRRTTRQALLDLRAATEKARTFSVQAGARLGTSRVGVGALANGCAAPPDATQIWVVQVTPTSFCVPSGLTADADGNLSVDYQRLVLGEDEPEYNGRLLMVPALQAYGFTASGRFRASPAGVRSVHLGIRNQDDNYTAGFRVLPSGVVCDANTEDATCDSD